MANNDWLDQLSTPVSSTSDNGWLDEMSSPVDAKPKKESLTDKAKKALGWNTGLALALPDTVQRDASIDPEVDQAKLMARRARREDVPEMTAESLGRDALSDALQIGPTAVKGVADIGRFLTGDRVGKDLSTQMDTGIKAIQNTIGSERGQAQRRNFEADMRDENVSAGELLGQNPGALADQVLPTVGSMFLPVGAGAAAGKVATMGNAAKGLSKAEVAARVAKAQEAAGIGTTAAQNAADTFSYLLEKGVSMEDAYKGAAITVPLTVIAGKLTGGGAETALTRAMTGTGAMKKGVVATAKAAGKEGAQETGEEIGQITGEAVGTGEAPTLNQAAKRMAVAGTLGAVVGGGANAAGTAPEMFQSQNTRALQELSDLVEGGEFSDAASVAAARMTPAGSNHVLVAGMSIDRMSDAMLRRALNVVDDDERRLAIAGELKRRESVKTGERTQQPTGGNQDATLADQILALEGNGNAAEVDATGNQGQRGDGVGSYGNLQPMPGLDGRGGLNAGTPVAGSGTNQSVGSPGGNNGAVGASVVDQSQLLNDVNGVTNAAVPEQVATQETQANDAQVGAEQAAAPLLTVPKQPTTTKPLEQTPVAMPIPKEIAARTATNTDAELALMAKTNSDPVVQEAVKQEQAKRKPKKDRKAVYPESDSALVAIAKLGGMDTQQLLTNGFDQSDISVQKGAKVSKKTGQLGKAPFRAKQVGFNMPIHRNGGMSFDGMREALVQYGYLPEDASVNDAIELLRRELRGEPVYTASAVQAQAEAAEADRQAMMEAEQEANEASGYDELQGTAEERYADALIEELYGEEVAALARGMRVAGLTEEEINAEIEAFNQRTGGKDGASQSQERSGEGRAEESGIDAEVFGGKESAEPDWLKDEPVARQNRTDQIGSNFKGTSLDQYLQEEPGDRNKLNIVIEFRQKDGTVLKGPRYSHIENAVRDGHRVVLTRSGPALVDEKMRGWDARDISPAGMRYANWLISQQEKQPSTVIAENEQESAFSLAGQTNEEAAAEYKQQQAEATKQEAEPPAKNVTVDQVDIFNEQGGLRFSKAAQQFDEAKLTKATFEEGDNRFETGVPVTFKYLHNKQSATKLFGIPDKDSPYDRGYEPSGKYVTITDGERFAADNPKQFESGILTFENPLVLSDKNWKRELSAAFGGLTGKRLSQAVIAAGYDGVVTIGKYGTSETLDLTSFDARKAKYSKLSSSGKPIESEALPQQTAERLIASELGSTTLAKVLVDSGIVSFANSEEELKKLGGKLMVAWHGSPHDHDKFDSSKIGTGEGAQAYGYGLYFASSKGVAEWYKGNLSYKQIVKDFRDALPDDADFSDIIDLFDTGHFTPYQERVLKALSNDDWLGYDYPSQAITAAYRSLDDFDASQELKDAINSSGKLYQVELAPSEDEYLDWDRPLSEQSKKVKKLINKWEKEQGGWYESGGRGVLISGMTGRAIYGALSSLKRSDKAASDYLHSIGIRGIRYLDGTSRGAGEGSSNYVIFSDEDVSITAKYAREQQILGVTLPDGRIILNLGALTEQNFAGVFKHEGWHSTVRELVGEETWNQLMSQLEQNLKLAKGNDWVTRANSAIPADTKASDRTEEIGAYAIEQTTNGAKVPNFIKRWVDSLLSAIRTALIRGMGGEKAKLWAMKNLKPQDLANLAIAGLKAKARNELASQGRAAMAYSVKRESLLDMPAVKIAFNAAGTIQEAKLRAKIAYAKLQEETQKNGFAATTTDGKQVKFSGAGFKEVSQHAADRRALAILANAKVLVESAMPLYSEAPSQKEQGVRMYHYYGVKADINGDESFALLEIKETTNGEWFYDADATDAETARAVYSAALADQTKSGAGVTEPTALKGRLAKWLAGVNGDPIVPKLSTAFGPESQHRTPLGDVTEIDVDGVMRHALNADGNKIHWSREGVENFWRWIDGTDAERLGRASKVGGDNGGLPKSSERNPYVASHTFDKLGRPRVFFHGSASDFAAFNFDHADRKDQGWLGRGAYVTSDPEVANTYSRLKRGPDGENVMPLYVAIHNPLVADANTKSLFRKQSKAAIDKWTDEMISRGWDSVILEFADGDTEIVVFNKSAVKSATGNMGDFDGSNPDIRYSKASPAQPAPLPEETKAQAAQRKIQDKFNRFTVIKDWLKSQGVQLSEQADVYKAEERMHSRFANKVEDFRTKLVEPLIKKIQASGFSMDDVSLFLHAQHAEERNNQIAKINPKVTDGSGMSTSDANKVLAAAPAELKALANEFRQITEMTKQTLLDAGIISQDMVDAWEGAYSNYVPLKGGPDEKAKSGTGKGLHVNGKMKRALGHGKREGGEWIAENILADYERAVMLAEKNRVGHHLVKMALEAGRDDLITLNKPEKRAVLRNDHAYEVRKNGAVIGVFNTQDAARMFKTMNGGTGITITKTNDPSVIYSASPMLQDNEANVYVNGHAIRVQINDELLAQAYKNLGAEPLNAIFSAGRMLNGYLSKAYTGYNPEFILTNIVRDFTTGLINITGEEGALFAAKAAKNYVSSFGSLLKYAVSGKETQWIKDYRDDGGNTGAAYLSDLERLGKEIKTEYDSYKGVIENLKARDGAGAARAAGRNLFNVSLKWIEHLNQAGENAMRLSIYRAAIESGKTRAEAASLAKNSTVNFNRKGELGANINALYLFFNAGVQGTSALAHAHFKGKHKYQAWALSSGMIGLGFLAAAAFGGGDEDDYDRELSDYDKSRNLVIRAGDSWVKIPVPYGYGFFYNLGRHLADAERKGEWDKMPWHLASDFVGEFTPFSGVVAGKEPDIKQAIFALPTVAQIPGALMVNRTGMGSPIFPESKFDENQPDNLKMWRNTKGTLADDLAQVLDKAGLEVSPETLKYLGRTATGGSGTFAASVFDAGKLTLEGADLETKEMPFVRKFVKEGSVSDYRSAFYEAKSEASKAADDFARAKKMGDMMSAKKLREDNRELIAMDKYADRLSKMIKAKRDMQDVVKQDEKLTVAEKRLKLKALELEEQKVYDRYLDIFKQRTKERRERLEAVN